MRPILLFSVLCCFAISPRVAAQQAAPSRVERKDFYVPTGDGIRLFLREVITSEKKQSTPILLIHGARVPEIALFEGNFRLCGPEVLPPNGKSTLGPRSSYKRALGGSRP